jgi:hypothetical protein
LDNTVLNYPAEEVPFQDEAHTKKKMLRLNFKLTTGKKEAKEKGSGKRERKR